MKFTSDVIKKNENEYNDKVFDKTELIYKVKLILTR